MTLSLQTGYISPRDRGLDNKRIKMTRLFLAMLGTVVVSLTLPGRTCAEQSTATSPECSVRDTLISGKNVVAKNADTFIRLSSTDGGFRELLPVPQSNGGMLLTNRFIPSPIIDSTFNPAPCSMLTIADTRAVSVTGGSCDSAETMHVDLGPVAHFAGAARDGNSAAVRVLVRYEKPASGVFNIDGWVGFSIDGAPMVALPAHGTEPVAVTAWFPHIPSGAHRISYAVYQGFDAEGAPQGAVCL